MKTACFSLPHTTKSHVPNPMKAERRAKIAALYAEHAESLREVAARIAGHASADDAVQDAFLELLANPRRIPTRATLAAIVRERARTARIESERASPLVWPGEDDEEETP